MRYFLISVYLIISFLLLSYESSFAQRIKYDKKTGEDVVKLKSKKYLMLKREVIYKASEDTVFRIAHNKQHKIRRNSKNFLERRLIQELVGTITTTDTSTQEVVYVYNVKGEYPFLPYKNKIIGGIRIKKMDVFTGSVTDTIIDENTPWLERAGNNSHVNTRDWVIRNNLLFKEGDLLDPFTMADNERILRSLPFLKDAKIYIVQSPYNQGVVDVLIVTQDVFSIGATGDLNGLSSVLLGVFDSNLMGTAQYLEVDGLYDAARNPNIGFGVTHRYENYFGSYINSEISYNNINVGSKYGAGYESGFSFALNRRFVTPRMKFAGGLEVINKESINVFGDSLFRKYAYKVFDVWVARAFAIKEIDQQGLQNRSRIIVAARYTDLTYTQRPLIGVDSLQSYVGYNRYLGSISFSKRKYLKTNYVYGFGRTEDIPYGSLIEATVGLENDDLFSRIYLGFKMTKAVIPAKLGYLYAQAGIGGYFKKNLFEQGVFKLSAYFFSNLIKIGKLRLRQFISFQYTLGFNRFVFERINLNNENGIKGFSSNIAIGTQKLAFNFESVVFTPLNIYGFRPAFFLFADVGAVGTGTDIQTLGSVLYSGIGVGIRIRNERLIFKTIQLGIAYYPIAPSDMTSFVYGFTLGETRPLLDDFEGRAPTPLIYR